MEISRVVDHQIYPRSAIADARQAYREYCTVKARSLPSNLVEISISVKPEHKNDAREVVLGFFNYALGRAAELHFEDE